MEKQKIFKQKKFYIGLILVLLIITIIGATYAFITMTITGDKKQVIKAGVLSLRLDEGDELTLSNALPMYDEVGMIQEPFTFSLTNTGGAAVDYSIMLDEIISEPTDQKCSSLGEITTSSPRECWKAGYPSELRQETLEFCKTQFPELEITTEEDCVNAVNNLGFFIAVSFEELIDSLILGGDIEDTRTVAQTYPDNYILDEFPKLDKYNVNYGLTKDGVNTINSLYSIELPSGALYIDSGTIEVDQTINYELRLWIADYIENNEDINGKSLKFKIGVSAGQVSAPNSQEQFKYILSNYVVKNYHACAEYLVEKGISSDYDTAILTDCQSITQGEYTIQNSYPAEFQEMLNNGIVKEEYGATITGFNYESTSLIIPSTILVDGSELNRNDVSKIAVPVVALAEYGIAPNGIIGTNSNSKKYSVRPLGASIYARFNKIVIPYTVLYIGNFTFKEVTSRSIEYSSNLQVIGNSVFSGTYLDSNITSLILPETVTYIGNQAFAYDDLVSIILPTNLIKIKDNAFFYNNLTTITIPENVTEIGNRAFEKDHNSTNWNLTTIVNKTNRAFDWYGICFNVSEQESLITGTVTNGNLSINIVSE